MVNILATWRDLPITRRAVSAPRKLMTRLLPRHGGPRIYGVGAAKTGTHSIAEMFAHVVRSDHEADCDRLIPFIMRGAGDADPELQACLLRRDRVNALRIDASQVNVYLIPHLLQLFPESRFILTIRHPLDWLRSIVDDSLRRSTSQIWMDFRDWRFSGGSTFPVEEEPLRARGLYTLDGYLGYYSNAVSRARRDVPADRLFIVRTDEIGERSEELAEFCALPSGIEPKRTHSFRNPKRFGVLAEIPRDHLVRKIRHHASDVLAEFFPERSLEDDMMTLEANRGPG